MGSGCGMGGLMPGIGGLMPGIIGLYCGYATGFTATLLMVGTGAVPTPPIMNGAHGAGLASGQAAGSDAPRPGIIGAAPICFIIGGGGGAPVTAVTTGAALEVSPHA